jgi:hypothetical protein
MLHLSRVWTVPYWACGALQVRLENLQSFLEHEIKRVAIGKVREEAQESILSGASAFLSTIDSVPALMKEVAAYVSVMYVYPAGGSHTLHSLVLVSIFAEDCVSCKSR